MRFHIHALFAIGRAVHSEAYITLLLSEGVALPQVPGTPSTQEVLSATLSDMRGRAEALDTSREDGWSDRSILFSLTGNPRPGNPIVSATRLSQQEHFSAASMSAKRLRHRAPKAAREAYEKAGKLARNNEDQKAATELERAIVIDTNFAEAHDDLGVLYTCLGRYPEAAVEFRRAMELVPRSLSRIPTSPGCCSPWANAPKQKQAFGAPSNFRRTMRQPAC